mgnify:FL=1
MARGLKIYVHGEIQFLHVSIINLSFIKDVNIVDDVKLKIYSRLFVTRNPPLKI